MGDVGPRMAPAERAGPGGSGAGGGTGHRPGMRSRFDVPVSLDGFPVLLNGELQSPDSPEDPLAELGPVPERALRDSNPQPPDPKLYQGISF